MDGNSSSIYDRQSVFHERVGWYLRVSVEIVGLAASGCALEHTGSEKAVCRSWN